MKNIKNRLKSIIGFVIIVTGVQSAAFAHNPPYAGKTDCGIIQSGVFYSNYYSPPYGTPAATGSCSWVKQGTNSCGRANYGGHYYTLYNYKWVCNVPLDTNVYCLIFGAIVLGYFKIRRNKTFAE